MKGLWLRATSSLAVTSAALLMAVGSAQASSDATVVRTTIASTVGYHSAYAVCPSGEDATGGGVALSGGSTSGNHQVVSDSGPVNSTGAFVSTTTGTVPVAWYGTSDIITSGSTAYVWAVCSSASTIVVRRTISSGSVTGFHAGFARCPTGRRATGGGVGVKGASSDMFHQFISDDGPVSASNTFFDTTTGTVPIQWDGTAYVPTPQTTSYVWAVCSQLATTVVRKTISVGARPGFRFGYARCPFGKRATGGGLGMSGGSGASRYQYISDTGPVGSTSSFDGTPTGTLPTGWYGTGIVKLAGTDYNWAVCG